MFKIFKEDKKGADRDVYLRLAENGTDGEIAVRGCDENGRGIVPCNNILIITARGEYRRPASCAVPGIQTDEEDRIVEESD